MPNLGPMELGPVGLVLVICCAIGHWGLVILRCKGRRPAAAKCPTRIHCLTHAAAVAVR